VQRLVAHRLLGVAAEIRRGSELEQLQGEACEGRDRSVLEQRGFAVVPCRADALTFVEAVCWGDVRVAPATGRSQRRAADLGADEEGAPGDAAGEGDGPIAAAIPLGAGAHGAG
jgi:hypothetical protein